jgi:hypothetical protein
MIAIIIQGDRVLLRVKDFRHLDQEFHLDLKAKEAKVELNCFKHMIHEVVLKGIVE